MLDEKKDDKEDIELDQSSLSSEVPEAGSPLDFSEEFKQNADVISSIIEQN
jgi:hypothetical protein